MPILENRTLDLIRHTRTVEFRGEDKALLHRARRLAQADRLLIELVVRDRLSRRKLGEIFEQCPATVMRRARRLLARLHDPLIIAILDEARPLAADMRAIGVDYFLLRKPLVDIAAAHKRTVHDVRGSVQYLRGWHKGLTSSRDWRDVMPARYRQTI